MSRHHEEERQATVSGMLEARALALAAPGHLLHAIRSRPGVCCGSALAEKAGRYSPGENERRLDPNVTDQGTA